MRRAKFRVAGLLCATSFAVIAVGAGAAGVTLKGVVGPGFTITLSKSNGSSVTKLDPGTYTFEIQDLSDMHNFHLTGPGVDKKTSVEEIVNTTWTVTLQKGTYTFLCDPHPSSMTRTFAVGSTTTPSAVKLAASVGATSISLTKGGAKVRKLTAGSYVVTVRDRTAAGNFHLTGPGVNRKTSIAGNTTAIWKLTLKAGTYTYRSDANPKLRSAFTVTAA